jgi:hypothetical protein
MGGAAAAAAGVDIFRYGLVGLRVEPSRTVRGRTCAAVVDGLTIRPSI